MNKIKKRLFAWICILFMLSNTVFTNTSLQVYAQEESNGVWSEDFISFDGQTFESFTLSEEAAFPKASNGVDNTDESGKFTATIPVEQVTGTKLEIKIAAEDITL